MERIKKRHRSEETSLPMVSLKLVLNEIFKKVIRVIVVFIVCHRS